MEYKYQAFISYSHLDEEWGEWLHKTIEKYKTPSSLKGKKNKDNEIIPTKITPIFRDREELPVRADLGEVIIKAIEGSKYLIVVCSPNSAKSMWVNKEIIDFKRIHGEDRVLAIIVYGEPNAKDKPDKFDPKIESFPEALKYKVKDIPRSDTTEDLESMLKANLSEERTEPLAADVREIGDGKERAKVKLIAGLLGVGFDELWEREKRRKVKLRVIWTSIIAVIFVIISALGIIAYQQKEIAVKNEKIAQEKQKKLISNLLKLIII